MSNRASRRATGRRNSDASPTPQGRVCVGWVDGGMVHAEWMDSLLHIMQNPESARRLGSRIRVSSGCNISKARNQLVRSFLNESDDEWLLMLDTDLMLPIDTLTRLLDAADPTARPIVSGLYYAFEKWDTLPPGMTGLRPLIFDLHPEHVFHSRRAFPHDRVVECHGVPTGCLLVHRAVYEQLDGSPFPWFYEQVVEGQWVSEDLTFCLLAMRAGFPIHVHTGVVAEHIKPTRLNSAVYAALGGPISQEVQQ